jgi:hypothetical protein
MPRGRYRERGKALTGAGAVGVLDRRRCDREFLDVREEQSGGPVVEALRSLALRG